MNLRYEATDPPAPTPSIIIEIDVVYVCFLLPIKHFKNDAIFGSM